MDDGQAMTDNRPLLPGKLANTPVGITGYAGHGKDTVAEVLIEEFGYTKLAFADPLRQFCSGVFGLTAQHMSDRVLKEQPLCAHAWPFKSRFEFRAALARPLALLTDTPVSVMQSHAAGGAAPDLNVACAGGLKVSNLYRQVADRCAIYIEPLLFTGDRLIELEPPSPRKLLQVIGTEVFRAIHPRFWANVWRIGAHRHAGRVVAPDVRFQSEIDALVALSGVAVRVDARGRLGTPNSAHASEALVMQLPVSHVFTNDTSLGQMRAAVLSWGQRRLST